MKKLRTFFRTLWKSATSPAYYKDIVQAPAGFSWKFLGAFQVIILLVLLPVFVTLFMVFLVQANLPQKARTLLQELPQDVVVSMTPAGLVVNKPLPYAVPLPSVFAKIDEEVMPEKNIVVFTSDAQVQSVASFSALQSYAVVTETRALLRKERGVTGMEVYDLPKEEWTTSSQQVIAAVNKLLTSSLVQSQAYLGIFLAIILSIWLLLTPFFWFGLLVYFGFQAVGAAILAFVVSVFLRRWLFAGKTYTFTQMVQVAIHVQIPLFVVFTLVPMSGILKTNQPWWLHALVVLALLWHVARMDTPRVQTPKKKSAGRK